MSLALITGPLTQLNPQQSHGTVFSYVLRSIRSVKNQEDINYEELLNRVKTIRCESSFKSLFEHFYPRLMAYFQHGGVVGQKASEMAQETLLAVWNKSHLFDSSKGTSAAWIYSIARNLRYDYFRSVSRDILQLSAEDLYENLEDQSLDLVEKLSASEIRARIDALPMDQREVIYGTYFEGYSHGEYAELKKIPLGTVKSRVRLALAQLKKGMEET